MFRAVITDWCWWVNVASDKHGCLTGSAACLHVFSGLCNPLGDKPQTLTVLSGSVAAEAAELVPLFLFLQHRLYAERLTLANVLPSSHLIGSPRSYRRRLSKKNSHSTLFFFLNLSHFFG